MYSKALLPNGLRVITVPMESVKSVSVLVGVATGSRYETKNINGISHFLEHLVFKGTKKRPTSKEIFALLDSVGAAHNAFTGKDNTGFYVKAPADNLELALDILSDVILNPIFAPLEIDKERGVIIEEINMYEDQPQALVGRVFDGLMFSNNPLGWKIEGSKEIISKISRDQVVNYVQQMYHSRSMVIGVAGKITDLSLIGKYFSQVPTGGVNNFIKFEDKQTKPAVAVHYKKTDQAHIVLGVRGFPLGHPDRFTMAVLANILGGNSSSRLFMEVREKRGLAYYVAAGTDEYHDTGVLAIGAGLGLDKIEEAIKVILGEIKDIRVTDEELVRAKNYFKGRMVLQLEDTFRVASYYTSQELLENKIETPDEVLAKVDKVLAEDVQRVAKDIFVSQKLNLAVVGPFKEKEKFVKLLKI